jgi:hypothetical protein
MFGGSGTLASVCENAERRWIVIGESPLASLHIERRMAGKGAAFEIMNGTRHVAESATEEIQPWEFKVALESAADGGSVVAVVTPVSYTIPEDTLESGAASAADGPVYLFARHTTTAFLSGGKADYTPKARGMSAPRFRYFYLDVNPEVKGADGGTLTLAPSGEVSAEYYDEGDNYFGPFKFTGERSFILAHHNDNDFYCLVDEKNNHGEFYAGSEAFFSRTPFSIELGGMKTSGTFPRIRTTKAQMSDKCAPYVEWTANGSSVTGLRWRFVDPSAPDKALTKTKSSQPAKVARIALRADGKDVYDEKIGAEFADGDAMEGSVTFPSPVEAAKISRIRVDFQYGGAAAENIDMVYSWWFYTK